MLVKHRLGGLDPARAMGASLAIAALLLAPVAALDPPHARADRRRDRLRGRARAAVHGGGFVVYAILIGEAGSSRATVITYVNPVVAVALGVPLLGEQPGAGAVAGLLLILAGGWLSTDGRLPPGARQPACRGVAHLL